MPIWYSDKHVADWLGVSVIDLPKVPNYWRERALTAMRAEAEARKMNSHKK